MLPIFIFHNKIDIIPGRIRIIILLTFLQPIPLKRFLYLRQLKLLVRFMPLRVLNFRFVVLQWHYPFFVYLKVFFEGLREGGDDVEFHFLGRNILTNNRFNWRFLDADVLLFVEACQQDGGSSLVPIVFVDLRSLVRKFLEMEGRVYDLSDVFLRLEQRFRQSRFVRDWRHWDRRVLIRLLFYSKRLFYYFFDWDVWVVFQYHRRLANEVAHKVTDGVIWQKGGAFPYWLLGQLWLV